ncbi:MAG TPA: TPM domain-containing protein [Ignavibacteria bacterium]|nr:TPM domain-containing protein [Ignavibacteria bacterium]
MKKDWIYKYFPEDGLKEIQSAVDAVEKKSTGEIVLSFRNKRSLREKLYQPHELAMKDFDDKKVWNTKERTGILVFIIFGEKYYEIIADEGIFKRIPDETWNKLEKKLKTEFRAGKFTSGVLHLIEKMGEVLEKEFPVKPGDENPDELKNEIEIN